MANFKILLKEDAIQRIQNLHTLNASKEQEIMSCYMYFSVFVIRPLSNQETEETYN